MGLNLSLDDISLLIPTLSLSLSHLNHCDELLSSLFTILRSRRQSDTTRGKIEILALNRFFNSRSVAPSDSSYKDRSTGTIDKTSDLSFGALSNQDPANYEFFCVQRRDSMQYPENWKKQTKTKNKTITYQIRSKLSGTELMRQFKQCISHENKNPRTLRFD